MANFKIMCPKCFAMVITAHPEAMMWELCPGCRRHVWEAYDLMMAEMVVEEASTRGKAGNILRLHNNS